MRAFFSGPRSFRSQTSTGCDPTLVSSVAWSTSVAPLYQLPGFVEVGPRTLNMDVAQMAAKIGPKTKGILLVQAMGNSLETWTMFLRTRPTCGFAALPICLYARGSGQRVAFAATWPIWTLMAPCPARALAVSRPLSLSLLRHSLVNHRA